MNRERYFGISSIETVIAYKELDERQLKNRREETLMKITRYTAKHQTSVRRFLKEEPWYNEFFTDCYTAFIAMENKKIIGVAAMSVQLGTAELNFISVAPQHHRVGIGSALYTSIEAYARKKKCTGIRVNCGIENTKAQAFYTKKGFAQTGTVKNYFSNNNTQVFFWKALTTCSAAESAS